MTSNTQGQQGIRFNDYFFSEPERLTEWVAPRCPGLFVILVQDPNWAPRPFQPLWFGEFGNNAQHLFSGNRHLGNSESFFVSVLPMLFSTTEQRCTVRDRLLWAYNPVLHTKGSPAIQSEWAHKLHDLEKKHDAQTAELRMLLSHAERAGEPQPKRRRQIGFLSDAELAG